MYTFCTRDRLLICGQYIPTRNILVKEQLVSPFCIGASGSGDLNRYSLALSARELDQAAAHQTPDSILVPF
jgi:hypothetical protein